MSRADEIAQGLREPSGCLTFGLDVLEYAQAHVDFEEGAPPPRMSSASYDLGRARAARLAEEAADTAAMLAGLRAEDMRRREVIREMIAHDPDVLAEFNAKMAELDVATASPADRPTRPREAP